MALCHKIYGKCFNPLSLEDLITLHNRIEAGEDLTVRDLFLSDDEFNLVPLGWEASEDDFIDDEYDERDFKHDVRAEVLGAKVVSDVELIAVEIEICWRIRGYTLAGISTNNLETDASIAA